MPTGDDNNASRGLLVAKPVGAMSRSSLIGTASRVSGVAWVGMLQSQGPRSHGSEGVRWVMTVRQIFATALLLLGVATYAAEHPELKPFPMPGPGMERFVIVLPHKERGEDEAFRVELVVGREMLTDGVNLMRLGNSIEPRILTGWGYTYYEVTGPLATMSTMMAPPPGTERVKRFVAAPALHIRYNSRLPVVVYVPEGFEVRYRVWEAPKTFAKAQEG